MTELPIERLREFGTAVYESVGMPLADAAVVVDVQLTADLRGVDTHGFQRLPWYVDRLRTGDNNPAPELRIVRETDVSVLLDGDNGLGQLLCTRLIGVAVEKARASGLAIAAVRHSNDWGCGAVYPLEAAAAGFVCFGTTTSIPTIAPFGTRTRILGNNPMVYAVPRRDGPPIVLDMALTPVALGKVMRAHAESQPIPLEWGFLDRDGRPTTDPATALGGVIPAIGGYKGTGLAMMMNVLAGILPGGVHSSAVENVGGKRGQTFVLISPSLFGETSDFLDEVEEMVHEVRAAEALPGSQGALLPGGPEARREQEGRRRGTLSYPPSVMRELADVARSTGVQLEV